jgi:Probable transposase
MIGALARSVFRNEAHEWHPIRPAAETVMSMTGSNDDSHGTSQNRKKSAIKLARLHQWIRNIQQDFLHKLLTSLAKTKQEIVVEDSGDAP